MSSLRMSRENPQRDANMEGEVRAQLVYLSKYLVKSYRTITFDKGLVRKAVANDK